MPLAVTIRNGVSSHAVFWCVPQYPYNRDIIIIIIIVIAVIEFSPRGSSAYTSTGKANKNKIHKRNHEKTQYKKYKTQ
jgi:hypothetical protein